MECRSNQLNTQQKIVVDW